MLFFGTPRRSPASAAASSARGGSPARTWKTVAQQATVGASGPTESRVVESGNAPARGTRARVGLNPAMPHSAAGMRTEPPVSVPSANAAMPSATDTAAPEDDPPGILRLSRS